MLPPDYVGLGSRVSEDFLLLYNWIPQDTCTISTSKVLLRHCGVFSRLEARNPFAGGGIMTYSQCRASAYTLSTNFAYRTSVPSCNLAATTMSLPLPVQRLQCEPSSNSLLLEFSYEWLVIVSLIILELLGYFIRFAGFLFSHNFRIVWGMLAKYCQM